MLLKPTTPPTSSPGLRSSLGYRIPPATGGRLGASQVPRRSLAYVPVPATPVGSSLPCPDGRDDVAFPVIPDGSAPTLIRDFGAFRLHLSVPARTLPVYASPGRLLGKAQNSVPGSRLRTTRGGLSPPGFARLFLAHGIATSPEAPRNVHLFWILRATQWRGNLPATGGIRGSS